MAEDEWRRLQELPVAKYAEALSARRKLVTRAQWIEDSVGHSYFWKGIVRHSLIPIVGVFIACVVVGKLQFQDGDNSQPDRGT